MTSSAACAHDDIRFQILTGALEYAPEGLERSGRHRRESIAAASHDTTRVS